MHDFAFGGVGVRGKMSKNWGGGKGGEVRA